MKNSNPFKWFSIVVILTFLLSAGCGGKTSSPTSAPTDSPSPKPSPTVKLTPTLSPLLTGADRGEPISPKVIGQNPALQEEVSLDGSIELYFDQPMEQASTAEAFEFISADGKAVNGQITWPEARVLKFTPDQSLSTSTSYVANLRVKARSLTGSPLTQALSFKFETIGDLKVSQVTPANGTVEVDAKSILTVIFNRPVVPLMIAEDQTKLPNPLEITPEVAGKGEWLNTSVFVFRPDPAFVGATLYQARVKAGLTDTEGMQLTEDYVWQFMTIAPSVDAFNLPGYYYSPPEGINNIPLNQSFQIIFRQPMDQSSTEAAFSLTPDGGSQVSGIFNWDEIYTSFLFTPTVNLELGTTYLLKLDPSAQAQTGGGLREGIEWHFTTVYPPAISGTYPHDGMVSKEYYSNLEISFISPMKPSSLKDKVIISPEPRSDAQWTYSDWGMYFFGLEPSTYYEVTILPGMEDVYGNQIKTSKTIHFTTGPYSPFANLLLPYTTIIYRLNGPQEFYVSYVNVKKIDFELSRLDLDEYSNLTSGYASWTNFYPAAEKLIRSWSEVNNLGLNQRTFKPIKLLTDEEKLSPGLYFLTIDSKEIRHESRVLDARILVVSSAHLTYKSTATEALLWLTDLDTSNPVPGADIQLLNSRYDQNNPYLDTIGHGVTDDRGLLKLDLPLPVDPMERRIAVAFEKGTDNLIALATNTWETQVYMDMFGIWSDFYIKPGDPVAYLYTDRPLYRPGQTVYFKGIVRANDDLKYSLPTQTEAMLTIDSYEGTVYSQTITLSEQGTFEGEFLLDERAALGVYTIAIRWPTKDGNYFGYVSFNVAEYRKPEFQLDVSTTKTDIHMGEKFPVLVEANFYSGGAVAEADVNWVLLAEEYSFYPTGDLANKGYSFTDFDQDLWYFAPYQEPFWKVIAQGKGKTDASGKLELTLDSDVPEAKGSLRLTLEATVFDITGNAVSERTSIIAHSVYNYPGIKSDNYVGIVDEKQTFSVVAVDWQSQPAAGQVVSVDIVERRWSSVQEENAEGKLQWTTSVEDIPVASFPSLTLDDQGFSKIEFTPPNGGIFKAIVTLRDSNGAEAKASAYIWIAGKEYVPWRQTNDRTFELRTDKKSYQPGETAEVLIASPFQGETYALITVERGHVLYQDVIKLTNNSTIYRLPIDAHMAPNVYISALVMKGVETIDGKTQPPNYKIGMVDIQVGTSEQTLQVDISTDKQEASPGEQVTYVVKTTDSQGNPVSAEVSLSLVDLAVLDLVEPNTMPLLDFFYPHRYLSVLTSIPLVWNIEEYNAQLRDVAPVGEGMGSGGGEKGAGMQGIFEVRGNFKDTAYWKARILTDQDGLAQVTITLPDNLTTWRMDARAVTLDTRVGQATSDLLSTKPLMVRPQTPRFFVVNDLVQLSAAVHNNTDQTLDLQVSLEANGVTITTPAQQMITLNPKSQALVVWDAVVNPEAEIVDLTYSAEGGGFYDASKPTLGTLEDNGIPVYRYEVPETVATAGSLNTVGARTESLALPYFENYNLSQASVTVNVAPSLAAGLTEGLSYLEHYPYECTEQIVSKFLPNVETTRALIEAGIRDAELESELTKQVNLALQRLYNQQLADGGWGWWYGENSLSDLQVTSYVVFGLVEAKSAGYTVDERVIERGVRYISSHVGSVRSLDEKYILNRQAFSLYVLAKAGNVDTSRNVQLYNIRQSLSLYGRAYLAMAIQIADKDDNRLAVIETDLISQAALSATGAHWSEDSADFWNWNTDTRSTAIILDALIKINPTNPLLENVVRWLMVNRTNGRWANTQETSWSIMALTDWMVSTGELKASYLYEVGLNGQSLGGGQVDTQNLRQTHELTIEFASLLVDQINRLTIARSDGPGTLYYTTQMAVDIPVEQVRALDRGIIIRRNYYSMSDPKTPINEINKGEVFLVRLSIIVPEDLHYVVIDDPLPAGVEAVDESLRTSQQFYEYQQSGWQSNLFVDGWGWWIFDHVEKHDEKVVLSVDYLPAGTYEYTYRVRATTPGTFRVIPPTAQEFYFPEVYSRGEGMLFIVKP